MVYLQTEVVVHSGVLRSRGKAATLEEAERMAALLIAEEEQAQQKAPPKVYLFGRGLLPVRFSNTMPLVQHYLSLAVSIPREVLAYLSL
jgi:hypothetical protein